MSSTLAIPGIGSGLDVNSIVTQLVAIERKPIDALNKATSTLQAKLSAFGLLQSYTVNIHDAVSKLAVPSFWQQTAAKSTDSSSVAIASSTSAANGSYSVEVKQLAQAQALASGPYAASTSSVGTGTLHIEMGEWNADKTSFTAQTPPSQIDVPVPLGEDSLESVRAKINASNSGVSASIVTDGTGSRLVIRSNTTGEEHSVRITATADAPATPGGPSLADLAYDPPNGANKVTETSKALDAKAKINGLDVVSSTNTLTNVSNGLSLTVAKVTTSPVTITVGLDTAAMKSAIGDFVKAYNDMNRYVADQTKYDDVEKVASTLTGDRSTLSLQSQLRSALGGSSGASAQFSRLSELGLEVQKDGNGSLIVNDAKLTAAMTDHMDEVAKAFSQTDTARPGNNGFAVSLQKLTGTLTNEGGLVGAHSKSLTDSIKRNNTQVGVYNTRVDAFQTRLLAQYSALDVQLNKLTNLNTYVTQQITTWNKST